MAISLNVFVLTETGDSDGKMKILQVFGDRFDAQYARQMREKHEQNMHEHTRKVRPEEEIQRMSYDVLEMGVD